MLAARARPACSSSWRRDPRLPVFAGCSRDFSDRRFQRLAARGLRLEIADIREGCSWVHGDDTAAVTAKAERIVLAAIAYPGVQADTLARTHKVDGVLVIGGGVSGTQAAAELAQMGHRVELVERRPFLGGRAARIGTVFPTNDCGQCLPTTDAQAGTRKCFHRNVAIDDPNLHIWRRTTVESVGGRPGDFEIALKRLPNIVTGDCINCSTCESVCPEAAPTARARRSSPSSTTAAWCARSISTPARSAAPASRSVPCRRSTSPSRRSAPP